MDTNTATCAVRLENHSFTMGRPTNGQFFRIEALKLQFTDDKYEQMANSRMLTARKAVDRADAFAHFTVLAPTMLTEMNFKSFEDLPDDLTEKLLDAYQQQFLPWYTPHLRRILNIEPLPAPTAPTAPAANAQSTPAA